MERPTDKVSRCVEYFLTMDEPLRERILLLLGPTVMTEEILGDARKPLLMSKLTLEKRMN